MALEQPERDLDREQRRHEGRFPRTSDHLRRLPGQDGIGGRHRRRRGCAPRVCARRSGERHEPIHSRRVDSLQLERRGDHRDAHGSGHIHRDFRRSWSARGWPGQRSGDWLRRRGGILQDTILGRVRRRSGRHGCVCQERRREHRQQVHHPRGRRSRIRRLDAAGLLALDLAT